MKIKPGKAVITLTVMLLSTLMTADMSYARMGGGGMGGSSGGGRSGGSGRGGGGSYGDRQHMSGDRDQDRMHSFRNSSNRVYKNISSGAMVGMGVQMELKPAGFEDGKLYVRFSARTQTGNLGNYDLKEHCTLAYEGGVIHPIHTEHMTGRQAEGIMTFDVDDMPEHFTIIINGIPGEEHRIHKW